MVGNSARKIQLGWPHVTLSPVRCHRCVLVGFVVLLIKMERTGEVDDVVAVRRVARLVVLRQISRASVRVASVSRRLDISCTNRVVSRACMNNAGQL
jgi:hypothetical protein